MIRRSITAARWKTCGGQEETSVTMSEGKKPVATVKASFKKETVPAAAALGTKTAEVKKPEASKAVSAKKPAAGNDKKEVTKVEEKKTVAKKPAAKKPAVKKEAPAAKKPAAEKKAPAMKKPAEVEANVVLQFNGNDYTKERLLQSAKDVWQFDQGRDLADLKKVEIFVKPEDGKAYVLANGEESYSFNI